ncbi:MAG: phosphotriesterase [Saprospiraceae bacterium]|nr:phosphotriesterase [Saprospiraceae bacterium]
MYVSPKLQITAICLLTIVSCQLSQMQEDVSPGGIIHSVNGKIDQQSLGLTLSHEHIMSNFGGEAHYDPNYDQARLFNQVIPYLRKIRSLGIITVFDCTTAYFGRDVRLLKELSDSTGIQIITNTGFYGAAKDRYVPALAFEKSISEIADIWISEFEKGIDNTGIKPGFIKLAFDDGSPSEIDLKLFEAGIVAHIATGLTLAVHTGNNSAAAQKQMDLLEKYNVALNNWIWVHAHKVPDDKILMDAAEKGAWISLDGCKSENIQDYISRLQQFKKNDLLGSILLSHDGNSFPRGKAIRPYHAIPEELIEKLSTQGFKAEEINLMLEQNPWQAFTVIDP